MVKGNEALGRRVVLRVGGREMGKVKDLIVDPTGQDLMGILIGRRMLRGRRVVRWPSIQVYGPNAVIIDARASMVRAGSAPDIKAALAKKVHVRGLKLMTTYTQKLGRISDLAFDEITGEVTGFELRSRRLYEATGGTSFLPTPKWIQLEKKSAVVMPESVDSIRAASIGSPVPGPARPSAGGFVLGDLLEERIHQ